MGPWKIFQVLGCDIQGLQQMKKSEVEIHSQELKPSLKQLISWLDSVNNFTPNIQLEVKVNLYWRKILFTTANYLYNFSTECPALT